MYRTSACAVGKSRTRRKARSRHLCSFRAAVEPLEPRLLLYALSGRAWANDDVSFSFVPDGTNTEGYSSTLFAKLNTIATPEVWQREFARALQTWSTVTPLNFQGVADDGSPIGTSGKSQGDSRFGDIRLSAHSLGSYVAYAYYPSSTTKGGDVVLNPDKTFHIGTHVDLYSVFLHEVGHSLGLAHSIKGTVMYGYITGVYSGLKADDIAGIQAIYGARQHDTYDAAASNDTLAAASQLTVGTGSAIDTRADLTSVADVDFYRMVVPTGADGKLTLSVDARGTSLLAPKVSVYDQSGNLVATATAGAAYGGVATVSLSGLTAGQTLYVAADGAASDVFGMGAYRLVGAFGQAVETQPAESEPTPTTPVLTADRYEVNDTWSTNKYLGRFNSKTVTGLSLHTSTDVDYLKFAASSTGTMQITVTMAGGAQSQLTVYDVNQNVLGASSTGSISVSLTKGQRAVVRISAANGVATTYDLAISRVSTGAGGKAGAKIASDVGHGTATIEDAGNAPHEHDEDHHEHEAPSGRGWQLGLGLAGERSTDVTVGESAVDAAHLEGCDLLASLPSMSEESLQWASNQWAWHEASERALQSSSHFELLSRLRGKSLGESTIADEPLEPSHPSVMQRIGART